jgi:hypothetical protein
VKFLTIRQPWASLIAVGAKTIETRPFSTTYRGPLAIHAGLSTAALNRPMPRPRPDPVTVGRYEAWDADSASRPHPNHPDGRPARLYDNDPSNWLGGASWMPLPLGAVVAVCDLVDVVPILSVVDSEDHPGPWLTVSDRGLCLWRGGEHVAERMTAQLPFGDFTPGRYAWLLDNVRPIEPVPMKGAQGLRDLPAEIAEQVNQ